MTPTNREAHVLRFSGSLYLYRIVNGVEQKGLGPLPASVVEFKPQSDSIDVLDTRRGTRGALLASVDEPKATDGGVEIIATPFEILAMLAQGAITAIDEDAGTVTDQAVTWEADLWTRLPHRHLSAVELTDASGTILYVEGTDYEINTRRGAFRPLVGSAMAAQTAGLISYAHGAVTGDAVDSGGAGTCRARLELDLENDTALGGDYVWIAPSAVLSPDGAINLVGKDPLTAKFKAKYEVLNGQPATRLERPTLA